jgi:hypothetical protein
LFDSSTETLVSNPIQMSHEEVTQQQVSNPIEVSYKDFTQQQVDVFTTVPDAREVLDDEVRQLTLITKLDNQNIFTKITARKQKAKRFQQMQMILFFISKQDLAHPVPTKITLKYSMKEDTVQVVYIILLNIDFGLFSIRQRKQLKPM